MTFPPYNPGDEKFRNYTPHQRHDPWERRPITYEGGEVFTVGERRYPGWVKVALYFGGSGLAWGAVIIFAVELAALLHRS